MKYTVLELTQNILSSMDSDEVTSISDTTEATQVANIIRTAYFNIISRADLPELKTVFKLTSSSGTDQPVVMYRPDDIIRIDWIKYNKADTGDAASYEYVTVLPLQQFLDMTHTFNEDETWVSSFTNDDGILSYYRTDKQPDFCTILDDNTIIFDGLDVEQDTQLFLDAEKSMAFGLTSPTFTLSDSFTPELDDVQFPLLLNEAKSLAFLELKQIANDSAMVESRRQWRNLQRTKDLVKKSPFDQLSNFGRRL